LEKKERLLVLENDDYIELKDISQIKNNNLLLNIASNYNLKLIFSYLKYNYILKLIKYNKLFQNQIGFDKQNYKAYCNTKYIIREKYSYDERYDAQILRLFAFIDLIWIIFYMIYKYLFQREISNNTLMDMAEKLLYNWKQYFIIYLLITVIIQQNIILITLMAMFILIDNFIILIILLSRLILIEFYSIDILFLLVNLAFIACLFCISHREIPTIKSFYLIRYKNIPVQKYFLKDFEEKEMNKYISKIAKKLKYNYSNKDLNISKEINKFRKNNHLTELKFEYNLPDFILNEISEIYLNNSQNVFKIKYKYLFKYKVGEFENHFKNKDKELIDILLKSDLETINIIVKGNIQFISIY